MPLYLAHDVHIMCMCTYDTIHMRRRRATVTLYSVHAPLGEERRFCQTRTMPCDVTRNAAHNGMHNGVHTCMYDGTRNDRHDGMHDDVHGAAHRLAREGRYFMSGSQ